MSDKIYLNLTIKKKLIIQVTFPTHLESISAKFCFSTVTRIFLLERIPLKYNGKLLFKTLQGL